MLYILVLISVAVSSGGNKVDSGLRADGETSRTRLRAMPAIDVSHEPVFTEEACAAIIEECNRLGWSQMADSIDQGQVNNSYSQDIYVKDYDKIVHDRLWRLIQPGVPAMDSMILERRRATPTWHASEARPSADWIFIRKYSPDADSKRNSLRVHADTNAHTINVPLNNEGKDFHGGGLFVMRPTAEMAAHPDEQWPCPDAWTKLDFVDKVTKRHNTSELVFPDMQTGYAYLYNNTVYHGVAPVEEGMRFSVSVFYDMPEQHEIEEKWRLGQKFVSHYPGKAKVVLVNPPPPAGMATFVVKDEWVQGESFTEITYPGHVFEVIDLKTSAVIERFEMSHDPPAQFVLGSESQSQARHDKHAEL